MNLPMLDLRTAEGADFSWRDLWQKRNVLVLLAHPDCAPCVRVLDDWGQQEAQLLAENTVPIVVYDAQPDRLPEGVIALVDPEGRLARAVGASPGTVLAVDRFFEILAREDLHDFGPDEAARDALDWVRLAERKCDECGIPTW